MSGAHTALIMCRIARDSSSHGRWLLTAIGDADHTARDWGSLIPEVKGYMKDLVPSLRIDPNERVAVMRKGGNVRLRDYCPSGVPSQAVLGLFWDVSCRCPHVTPACMRRHACRSRDLPFVM